MLKPEVADKLTEFLTPMAGRRILEIGTGWAESAALFSRLKPGWKIYTIDALGLYGDRRIIKSYQASFVFSLAEKVRRLGNVIQVLGNSQAIPWELPIDALMLDGDHTYSGCMADWLRFNRWVVAGGIVCFDDYTQTNNKANGVARVVGEILGRTDGRWEPIHQGYYCAILRRTTVHAYTHQGWADSQQAAIRLQTDKTKTHENNF